MPTKDQNTGDCANGNCGTGPSGISDQGRPDISGGGEQWPNPFLQLFKKGWQRLERALNFHRDSADASNTLDEAPAPDKAKVTQNNR